MREAIRNTHEKLNNETTAYTNVIPEQFLYLLSKIQVHLHRKKKSRIRTDQKPLIRIKRSIGIPSKAGMSTQT